MFKTTATITRQLNLFPPQRSFLSRREATNRAVCLNIELEDLEEQMEQAEDNLCNFIQGAEENIEYLSDKIEEVQEELSDISHLIIPDLYNRYMEVA